MILISGLPRLIYWLPRSVLAGIVWNACIGMFPFEKMKELAKIDTRDSYIVFVTLVCTAVWGIFQGIEVGFALSVVLLLQRTSKPHCSVMGRVAHSTTYGGITTWPDAITTNGILIFRVDGALYFGNCNYLKRAVQVLVARNRRHTKPLYYFMLDCHAMNDLDSSGVLALDIIAKYLHQNQIVLILTGVKYPVMKIIKRSHLVGLIGVNHFFHSVFHAHMDIYARVRLCNQLGIDPLSPFDYIDKNGKNLINFSGLALSDLERPLTTKEKETIVQWDPYKFSISDHPLNKIKKGFEISQPIGRISLALKAETIALELAEPTTIPQLDSQTARIA
ncbi:sulfate transporter [Reticulomyxa filosa]|uniref:Sulfate transporter n=1 Tax=Reticulomyxa filosa TaxID=46433 RepID=X6NPQ4_RETFI|nr:sulfate transporter [Reticulomyxa filosa]|eukprot:ETO27873.1 sulfate transporter [Reticulomyxa filosa]